MSEYNLFSHSIKCASCKTNLNDCRACAKPFYCVHCGVCRDCGHGKVRVISPGEASMMLYGPPPDE